MLVEFLQKHISESAKERLKRRLESMGFAHYDWVLLEMHRQCTAFIQSIEPQTKNVLEISAGRFWKQFPFKRYQATQYPGFDICSQQMDERFDLIIADQVFEHLLWPYRAGRNCYEMLADGGYLLISTPFLLRIHAAPHDCSRWTETGLRYFLAECGFDLEQIQTGSWGNRQCIKANFKRWAKKAPWSSMRNEPNFPVTVWAIARKVAKAPA